MLRSASLALKLLASSVFSVLCFAARAFAAAERLKTAPSSAVTSAPFVLTGDMIKWGGLATVFGTAYLFRKEEVPILTETVVDEPPAAASPAAEPPLADGDAAPPAELDMMGDLKKRMQQLAEERAAAEAAEADDAPVDDSSEEWGRGNTGVLEPPKPKPDGGLLEDGPAVDFPVGFPLRDMDEPEPLAPTPESATTATQEEIEMLERMFGTRSDD